MCRQKKIFDNIIMKCKSMNDVWIAYLLISRDQFGVDTDPMQKMQSQSELGQNHNKKKKLNNMCRQKTLVHNIIPKFQSKNDVQISI